MTRRRRSRARERGDALSDGYEDLAVRLAMIETRIIELNQTMREVVKGLARR